MSDQQLDHARQLLAIGTPGSVTAKDGRRHWRDIPCPGDLPRYLTADEHMWLPFTPPYDLRKVNAVLNEAFDKPGIRR